MKEPSQTVDQAQPERAPPLAVELLPRQIGRYRVERLLGKGGFGLVFLAHDDQLQRPVAIKVPHAHLVAKGTDAEAYLAEARTVANLDHPNIVPVFDVGNTDEFPCYVVSKYIDGRDLATRLKHSRFSVREAVELVATVAEALHFAHKHGLVHRDIKPGNLLLDSSGKPFVADFGLTLREHEVGRGPHYVGTPAYMSPEQARGEGHRVDGRSDIFSLGVVLYELLVGRRPFKGDSEEDLLEKIASVEARPPRQSDDAIPKEVERICLKAISKRASERYTTALDLADDLQHFLEGASDEEKSTLTGKTSNETEVATAIQTPKTPPASDSQPVKIVPKGLRSFDAHDADFFLELLPGPRDRGGLPDSIRFWKSRIETTNADSTFAVGLIYGPSGCGKSSLVKAGLLPRLAKSVMEVYIEATSDDTEGRLLKRLRQQMPDLPGNLRLIESLSALRRGKFLKPGQKVLLVLDQFEQWLHAKHHEEHSELVQALRQCDGGRVQAVVMVRDDFWLAVSRFMKATEVEILEGRNSALVDLFDLLHAYKVLAAYGRAYGRLSENAGQCSKEQNAFLEQAVADLAQEGKVISVRLALFAEMVKGKPWTPATLTEVGGTDGVGVTFLEETFTASTAPPQHRLHQKAAQAVLKALLPEAGTDIKGHMRSQRELLEASGHSNRLKDFDDVIRILDSELRLITPTDPEGKDESDTSTLQPGAKYFQLTHDYLVPSLRDWLTRKQKETRRGQAELVLADRAVVWNARPENRQLPSLVQWCQIKRLTNKKNLTPPQRKMMAAAGRHHAMRGAAAAMLLTVLIFMGVVIRDQAEQRRKATHAAGLVHAVLNADTTQTAAIIGEMVEYRKWTDPLLRNESQSAAANSRQRLHASLALLPVDPSQVDYLYGRLLDAQPQEVSVIRDALTPHKDGLVDKLWAAIESAGKGKESQRLRAAAALAKYDPDNPKWSVVQGTVGDDLVTVPPVYLSTWMDALRPVRIKLLQQLSAVFRDADRQGVERSLATDILADYAADDPTTLANLLMDADEKQFGVIFLKLKELGENGLALLNAEIDKKLPGDLASSDEKRETLAKRQANAAVALLRMNQPDKVWKLLAFHPTPDDRESADPRVRSYLIHRLSPLGATAEAIIKRLDEEADNTARRALILSLGEFSESELPPAVRASMLPKLQAMYHTETDAGLHASVEWLLRSWQHDGWLTQVNDEWKADKEQRDKRFESIQQFVKKGNEQTPQWYVNSQGQTMVAIPGPVEFLMGSPKTEKDREKLEVQHLRRIGRSFAIASKSVTLAEYRTLTKDAYEIGDKFTRYPDLPVVGINWYMTAQYCNLLSKEEGIDEKQWCWEIKGDGISLKENYLSLTGYRLTTEAEMEYATRAQAVTSRYYGETGELLENYAWYIKSLSDYRTDRR